MIGTTGMTYPVYHIRDHALDFVRVHIDAVQLQGQLESGYWYPRRLIARDPTASCSAPTARVAESRNPRLLEQSSQTALPRPLDSQVHAHAHQAGLRPFQPFVVFPHVPRLDGIDERRVELVQSRMP